MLSEKFMEVLSSGRTLVDVYCPLAAISTPFSKASFTRLEVSLHALVNRLLPYHTFPHKILQLRIVDILQVKIFFLEKTCKKSYIYKRRIKWMVTDILQSHISSSQCQPQMPVSHSQMQIWYSSKRCTDVVVYIYSAPPKLMRLLQLRQFQIFYLQEMEVSQLSTLCKINGNFIKMLFMEYRILL